MTHELKMVAVACALSLCACGDKKNWTEERQKAADEAKATRKQEQEERDRRAGTPAAAEPVPTDPFWDNPSYIKIANDSTCPENLWALFQDVPGGGDAERKANKAKQPELARALKAATFTVKLRAPDEVKLLEYDAAKGYFPLELVSLVDCSDSIGHLGVAFSKAKAVNPASSAAQKGAQVQENIWEAPPQAHTLPMKSMSEAKEFKEKHRLGLEARIVFKVGPTEVNRKMIRSGSGQMEDWGAGRLIQASVVAVRVTADRGKTVLIDQRK
jgi:hypothetical protein